jgi:hypothetical protein
MAQAQVQPVDAVSSVDRIASDISSSMQRHPNLGASSIVITPELYRQLQDPQVQQALIARLEREHPGHRFRIENFLRADQMGEIGFPSVQIGMERFAKRSTDEISREIGGEMGLGSNPALASSSITLTPELYRQLQDPQAQAALLEQLGREHPGYRFTISRFIPTFEHGDIGMPGIVIGVERYAKRSADEMCSELRTSLLRNPRLESSTFTITEPVFRQLQDPQARAEFLARLARENPGYRFSIERSIPAEQHGELGMPGIEIGIRPEERRPDGSRP